MVVEPKVLEAGGELSPCLTQSHAKMSGQWKYSYTILFCKPAYSRYTFNRFWTKYITTCLVTNAIIASTHSSIASLIVAW
jgi:hypothetical protein